MSVLARVSPIKKTTSKSKPTSRKAPTVKKGTSSKMSLPSISISSPRTSRLLRSLAIWVSIFIVTLVGIDYAVQYLNYKASVAIVNGERIYRGEYVNRLSKAYGNDIVTQLIDEVLIAQGASKLNITIPDKDIDELVATQEEQAGGKEALLQALDEQGYTMEDLRKNIENYLIIKKKFTDDVTVTDEEKQAYYDQYKESILEDNADPTYEEAESTIEEKLIDEKYQTSAQEWYLQLQEDATIKNNIENPKDYSFLGITRSLFSDLFD